MSGPSLDQRRAKHALGCIGEVEKNREVAGKYVGYVKALPASILTNGLGQALATELAAKEKARDALAEDVAVWLLQAPGSPYAKASRERDPAKALLGAIVAGDQRAYVWAQAEALAYVGWLKKLAVAFLKKSEQPAAEAAADAR